MRWRRDVNYRGAIVLLILAWIGTAQAVAAQSWATPAIKQQTDEVASLLEGVMDTTAQASANPQAPSVQMTTCRVQVAIPELAKFGTFLYQEQALTKELAKPYRQRLLWIAPTTDSDRVQSLSSKLAAPEQWAGLCGKPESQRIFREDDLGEQVCIVYLKKSANGYLGETAPQGCPANVRGAVRITNTIELNANGMNTWDRGFDANGNQVWGAQSEAYQFRRRGK